MQTPKKRSESSNLGRRAPPITPPARRKISLDGSESSSSPHAVKTPTHRSPKVADHKSPRTSVSKSPTVPEKKRPSKVSTLESQVSKLQEDLKKTKDLLDASESQRVQAEQEAQEAKKQSTDAIQKLEDVQRQLRDLTESGDARVQELNKIGLERDKAWQAEVEALREKQSAALSSAMSEVQMLKLQLEGAANSGTCQANQVEVADDEVQDLKEDLANMLAVVDTLKSRIVESEKVEEEYQMLVSETQVQLEVATGLINTLRSDGLKAADSFNCVVCELEKSRAHVTFLEETIRDSNSNLVVEVEHPAGMELNSLQLEINQLKAANDDAEKMYQEQQMKHALEIQTVREELNSVKAQSSVRESELETMLKDAKAETAELRAEKDAQLQGIISTTEKLDSELEGCQDTESESGLETKIQISMAEVSDLKSRLADKDAELKTILEENERLKMSIEKKEAERSGSYESAIAERDLARAAEQEAVVKIGIVTEEADKNSRRAARISEQLEATQEANAEMEAELRRIKIQSEQWRKAAEAAAAILSSGKNGEMMERSGSYNPGYNSIGGKLLNSPFSDDLDDESPKKKGNMFKKFGGMWKKGQK